MTVIPANAEMSMIWLPEQLENLPGPLRLADAVTRDHDDVANAGCLCGCVHRILLADPDRTSMPRGSELAIGTTTDLQ
jgi:hypothetical protein